MPRPAMIALALLGFLAFPAASTAATSVVTREACEGFGVEAFVGKVPYFRNKMERVRSPDAGGIAFAHPDDARINVSFRTQAVPEAPSVTRADYLKDLRARLDQEVQRVPQGVQANSGVFPYNPVSWSLRTRTQAGNDVDTAGTLTLRLAPTCHLIASWKVFEQPILGSRISEFLAALDAVRLSVAPGNVETDFLPDNNVPTGIKAIVLGFIFPILASLALMYGLKGMLYLPRPGRAARSLAAAGAAGAAAMVYLQAPVYIDGFEELRYMENLGLLILAVGIMAPAAALGGQKAALSAFSISACVGLVLTIGALMGWSPDLKLNLAAGLFLMGVTGLALWVWTQQASRKRKPNVGMARAA